MKRCVGEGNDEMKIWILIALMYFDYGSVKNIQVGVYRTLQGCNDAKAGLEREGWKVLCENGELKE
jgi:hypothetical protein